MAEQITNEKLIFLKGDNANLPLNADNNKVYCVVDTGEMFIGTGATTPLKPLTGYKIQNSKDGTYKIVWYGTYAEYNALETYLSTVAYIISDIVTQATNINTNLVDHKAQQSTDNILGHIKIGYTENLKNYAVKLDNNNKAYVTIPWSDTDTHYTAKNIIANSATSQLNVNTITSNPFLNLLENSAIRSSVQIVGTNATTVNTNADGSVITISTIVPAIPNITISNGAAVTNNYISSLTANGHTIVVTKAALPTTLPNPNALTLKINSGTTEGTDLYTYSGNSTKSLNILAGNNITLTSTAGQLTINATVPTIPDINISNGESVANNYISGISASGHTITVTKSILPTLAVSITGSGNAITDISVTNHTLTAVKGITFLTTTAATQTYATISSLFDNDGKLLSNIIPEGALSKLSVAATETAAVNLVTTKIVQNGDTVKVTANNNTMYYVANETKTTFNEIFEIYTAGQAVSAQTADIAKKLENKINFTGAVSGSFDGSSTTTISIPTIPTTLPNPFTLTCQLNGVTQITYSGSSAQTFNIPVMSGATATNAGTIGLVPASIAGNTNSFLCSDGTWTTPVNTTYAQATSSVLGLVKIGYTESGKNYPVELNGNGQMFVNVPWTDTNNTYNAGTGINLSGSTFSLNIATYNSLGGLLPWKTYTSAATGPGQQTAATVINVNALTTTSGRYYAVEADVNGKPFVNVPWSDTNTNTTYTFASGSNGTFTVTPSGSSVQTINIGKPDTAGTADVATVSNNIYNNYDGSNLKSWAGPALSLPSSRAADTIYYVTA